MKKVGIVARTGSFWDRSAMYMFENYRLICFENNCLPFMILPPQLKDYYKTSGQDIGHLNDNEKEYLKSIIDECDGIIIPGGDRWYDYDQFIYKYAYFQNKAILGICMGMQVMVSCDNELKPILNDNDNHYKKKVDYAHKVKIDKNSKLYQIIGKEEIEVNSYHNYHIEKTNNLQETAYSEDGYIEAVEDPNKKFVIGIQWHPEIMYDYDIDNKKIIKAFIDAL